MEHQRKQEQNHAVGGCCHVQKLSLIVIVALLNGCVNLAGSTPTPTAPVSVSPPSPTITPQQSALDGWTVLAPGLELRSYIPDDSPMAQLLALRIDPAYYVFRAHYDPGEAHSLHQWNETLPGAVAFINANFFDADSTINGLLVADGVYSGTSYRDFGGMFQVQNGVPRVRSLIFEPYMGETLEQAVQAFPMLVVNGAQAYFSSEPERVTRRTVVGQDSSGRILLMVTPMIGTTLADLSAYLPTTDMNLVSALNLDGGGSTLLYVGGESPRAIASFDPVPAVLAVYAR
jgi:hypothetical protein